MGFAAVARHRSKNVTLYRQGDVNFIVNAEPESFAQAFARAHGPSVCAMAFRVADAAYAYKRALELGAKPFVGKVGPMEFEHPGHQGSAARSFISSTAMDRTARSTTSISSRSPAPISRTRASASPASTISPTTCSAAA
jgi:4-hydroxyphenylpyruvate dioxygenase-like putative hemolysin